MASSTEPPQAIKNNKTCVLRVSIHCQGCKRKVQKLLQSLPGVENIEIDRQQQRVVVTGDVSPESLIRKLAKSRRHAELWPEITQQKHTPRTEKTKVQAVASSEGGEAAVQGEEVPAVDGGGGSGSGSGKANEGVGEKEAVEVKTEEKKPETGSASDQASPPVAENKERQKHTENDGGAVGGGGEGGDGGGSDGKKKKKNQKQKEGQKIQNSNKNGMEEPSSIGTTPPPPGPPPPATTARTSDQSSQHDGNRYPAPYHRVPPPAPLYTVSYNTAQPPVNSYTASYYATPPPQAYAYSHFGSQTAPPPPPPPSSVWSEYELYTQQQQVDSFEIFSDENPNGCLVM